MTGPVVVGIDDVEHSTVTIAAAARETRARRSPLWLGHVYHRLLPTTAGLAPGGGTPEGAVRDAATMLPARAVTQVRTPPTRIWTSTATPWAGPEVPSRTMRRPYRSGPPGKKESS